MSLLQRNSDAVLATLSSMERRLSEQHAECAALRATIWAALERISTLEASVATLRARTAGNGPTIK